jgi:hypothetical protein
MAQSYGIEPTQQNIMLHTPKAEQQNDRPTGSQSRKAGEPPAQNGTQKHQT